MNKDSDGKIDKLKVWRGKSKTPLELQFVYGSNKLDVHFSGRRADLPSLTEIVALINEKFMERLGTIGTIGTINTVEEIIAANVKTTNTDNIIIDLLKVGAVTSRQTTLENHGTQTYSQDQNLTTKRGKFFPRGARGFLTKVQVYLKNTGGAAVDVTVHISPNSSLGDVYTSTLSINAGAPAGWFSFAFNKYWNYDSLFIWVEAASDAGVFIYYDLTEPFDYTESTDGLDWTVPVIQRRYKVKADLVNLTLGDLNVTGTVNTVKLPNIVTTKRKTDEFIARNSQATLLEILGAGELTDLSFVCMDSLLSTLDQDWTKQILRFVLDGVTTDYNVKNEIYFNLCGNQNDVTQSLWNAPVWSEGAFPTLDDIKFNWRRPLPFRKKAQVIWLNTEPVGAGGAGDGIVVSVIAHANLIC